MSDNLAYQLIKYCGYSYNKQGNLVPLKISDVYGIVKEGRAYRNGSSET
jgi:hypothetical protein